MRHEPIYGLSVTVGPPQLTSLASLLSPEGLVKAAGRAHPAFKFAIVVAGIGALVAIVSKFGVSVPTLVFGALIILFFMFVFLIFAVAAQASYQAFGTVVMVVVWALAILFILALVLLLTSAFFDTPIKLRSYLESTINPQRASVSASAPESRDAAIQALIQEVQKLQGAVLIKSKPGEIEREAELRHEEPERFRREAVYWPKGATIRVGFLDGKKAIQDRVLSVARDWTKYANINFASAAATEADVRVSFKTEGEWSFMGTQCLAVPKNEPTTSLGPPIDFQNEKESRHYILHAFGHVLGLIHEFQIPAAKGVVDLNKAYQYFAGAPFYWSKEQFDNNVAPLKEVDAAYAGESFDPYSVMLGSLPDDAKIVKWSGPGGSELSSGDISLIRKIYPGR